MDKHVNILYYAFMNRKENRKNVSMSGYILMFTYLPYNQPNHMRPILPEPHLYCKLHFMFRKNIMI